MTGRAFQETPGAADFNHELQKIRAKVEQVNGRIKNSRCLSVPWRHQYGDLNQVFRVVVCKITNLDLIEHPINADDSDEDL